MYTAVGMIAFCYPFSHKDIVNLSNGNHIISGILQGIQRRQSGGFQRIIMAVTGPFEFAALFAHIGSCDNTANSPLIPHSQFSGNLTVMIQGLKSHGFLIATDLKHRIR